MSAPAFPDTTRTYNNPVYPRSFPDPFVLKHGRDYFAYCTGFHEDGNVFGTLHSTDLVRWNELGGAMRKLDNDAPFCWAPEVTFFGGRFYLYYSVGNETLMEIRLAVSDRPDGGFVDVGTRLTHQEFAIDPHVFIDDDGERYLFYATDFLEHTHIGTGTVVDRMIDWDELEGRPRPVTRARYDWQVYDPKRKEKGGVRWHTVEGPFVLKRKGRYFEMFSGGNWQNTSYGVSFATSDRVLSDCEWRQFSDGEKTLPIIRTKPEMIVGPGHNSVVRGPNGRELYCVYHRWTEAGRVMAIDRMDFAGDRIFVCGPTDGPQPVPLKQMTIDASRESKGSDGSFRLDSLPVSFLSEFTVVTDSHITAGFELCAGNNTIFDYFPEPVGTDSPEHEEATSARRRRILGLDVDGRKLRVSLDGIGLKDLEGLLTGKPESLMIFGLCDSTIPITEGFEELFEQETDPTENGWRAVGEVRSEKGGITLRPTGNEGVLGRDCFRGPFELAVNLRVDEPRDRAEFGIRIVGTDEAETRFGYSAGGIFTTGAGANATPVATDVGTFAITRQLRLMALPDETMFYLDGSLLKTGPPLDHAAKFEIFCRETGITLDMVRLTRI